MHVESKITEKEAQTLSFNNPNIFMRSFKNLNCRMLRVDIINPNIFVLSLRAQLIEVK